MQKVNFLTVAAAVAIMTLAASCGQTSNKQTQASEENSIEKSGIGGTYWFGDGDGVSGPSGYLEVYPLDANSALFHLEITLGEPSYNSGQVVGKMTIENNIGIYDAQKNDMECDCILKFAFASDELKLTADSEHSDCDYFFGNGVFNVIERKYIRINSAIPRGYETMEGDSIMFEDLK